MDVQPIDQGSVIRSGFAAVPDYLSQQIQRQLADAQTQQSQAQVMAAQTAHAAQQREAQQLQAYQAAVTQMGDHPTLQQHLQLMRMFPGEYSAAAGRAWEAQDKDQRDTDFSSMAQIHDALRNGHPELAHTLLRARHDADAAAGHPDPVTEQMLAALDSGDATQIAQATEMARRTAAIMAGPDKFASVYGADEPHVESIAPANVAIQTNAPGGPRLIGQSPIPAVHAAPNGAFDTQGMTPGVPILGFSGTGPGAPTESVQPATGTPTSAAPAPSASNLPRAGQPMPTGMFQGWRVIGVPGDPRRRGNGRVDSHNGVDFQPPAGNPHLTADRPLDVIGGRSDAGDANTPRGRAGITAIVQFPDGAQFNLMHLAAPVQPGHYEPGQVFATAGGTGNAHGSTQIHVQPWGGTQHDPRAYFGGGVGTAASPVRVRTVQQANALPPGTHYTTPDNRSMVR